MNILKELDDKKSEKSPEPILSDDEQLSKTNIVPNIISHSQNKINDVQDLTTATSSFEKNNGNNVNHTSTLKKVPSNRSPQNVNNVQSIHEPNINQPINNKKKKKRKKQRNRLPGVLILTTLIFAVSICLALVIIAYGKDMLGIGKDETTHLIIIPEGATTEDISLMLEADGIIKSPEFFKLFSRLSGKENQYIAGEHFVRPNMAYETIIQELTSIEDAQKESVQVTFPEGITLYDAAILLEKNGICDAEQFIFYFNAGNLGFEFENKINSSSSGKFYRMEGFLFPDTYYFYLDMEPEQVCQKIYLNFNNKMTEERYKKMEKLGLNLEDLITFSSIVQKEAPTKETMIMVASVFWNRLNNSDRFPMLESDPTSNYSEFVIKPHMQVYDQAMLDSYDTYKSPGLPPGAICNPGIEAIDAVLEAFPSDYFFFIANIYTKETLFATTLEQHYNNEAVIKEQIAQAEATANQEE